MQNYNVFYTVSVLACKVGEFLSTKDFEVETYRVGAIKLKDDSNKKAHPDCAFIKKKPAQ